MCCMKSNSELISRSICGTGEPKAGTLHARCAHLRGHAEDVRVVPDKTAHASQTREGTRRLVSVEDTKLGHADGELPV